MTAAGSGATKSWWRCWPTRAHPEHEERLGVAGLTDASRFEPDAFNMEAVNGRLCASADGRPFAVQAAGAALGGGRLQLRGQHPPRSLPHDSSINDPLVTAARRIRGRSAWTRIVLKMA